MIVMVMDILYTFFGISPDVSIHFQDLCFARFNLNWSRVFRMTYVS